MLLQLHAHLNAVFAHFVEFNMRFHTVEDKEIEVGRVLNPQFANLDDLFKVLDDLIVALRLAPTKDDDNQVSSSTQRGRGQPRERQQRLQRRHGTAEQRRWVNDNF